MGLTRWCPPPAPAQPAAQGMLGTEVQSPASGLPAARALGAPFPSLRGLCSPNSSPNAQRQLARLCQLPGQRLLASCDPAGHMSRCCPKILGSGTRGQMEEVGIVPTGRNNLESSVSGEGLRPKEGTWASRLHGGAKRRRPFSAEGWREWLSAVSGQAGGAAAAGVAFPAAPPRSPPRRERRS